MRLAGYQPLLVVLPANRGRRRGLGVDGPHRPTVPEDTFLRLQKDDCLAQKSRTPGQPQAGPPADSADRPGGHGYRRPNTSKPNPGHKVYPYLLRGLEINRVNQVWATDITYIPMARGFLYLVAIMDWHSRYVLAWRLSNTLEVDFCVEALEEALSKGRPQIFNTDQGSQFTSEAFTSMLLAQGVQVSMDGRGRCMVNVFVERLWRSIKYEEVYLKAYQNGTEARKGIGAYLAFYNQERPHQALGYRSPGQVFHAVSPQRCLLELPRALPSDEGLRDTPALDSLILASPLS